MKKLDFSYLFSWTTTLILVSLLYYWLIDIVRTIGAFFIEMIKYIYLFAYAVGTVIICAVLAKTMYSLGIRINHNRSSVPLGIALVNQLIGASLHVAIFAIFKGRGVIDPCVILFTQYNKFWTTNDIIVENPLSELIILCTIQTLIYSSVSLLFYFIAKRKQDRCKERPEY